MNKTWERLKCGMVTENPTFVQMLGMCPTMAVTTSAINGLGMGLTTTVILILSNMMISALRKVIPDKVRIPDPFFHIIFFIFPYLILYCHNTGQYKKSSRCKNQNRNWFITFRKKNRKILQKKCKSLKRQKRRIKRFERIRRVRMKRYQRMKNPYERT